MTRGADLDARQSVNKSTALLVALLRGHEKTAVRLLGAGADPNLADDAGHTPLMVAARMGSLEAVRALLEHGASVEARDAAKLSALTYATKYGHKGVAMVLRRSEKTARSAGKEAAKASSRILLKKKDQRDSGADKESSIRV